MFQSHPLIVSEIYFVLSLPHRRQTVRLSVCLCTVYSDWWTYCTPGWSTLIYLMGTTDNCKIIIVVVIKNSL